MFSSLFFLLGSNEAIVSDPITQIFIFYVVLCPYGVFIHWNQCDAPGYVKFWWVPGLLLAGLISWLSSQPPG